MSGIFTGQRARCSPAPTCSEALKGHEKVGISAVLGKPRAACMAIGRMHCRQGPCQGHWWRHVRRLMHWNGVLGRGRILDLRRGRFGLGQRLWRPRRLWDWGAWRHWRGGRAGAPQQHVEAWIGQRQNGRTHLHLRALIFKSFHEIRGIKGVKTRRPDARGGRAGWLLQQGKRHAPGVFEARSMPPSAKPRHENSPPSQPDSARLTAAFAFTYRVIPCCRSAAPVTPAAMPSGKCCAPPPWLRTGPRPHVRASGPGSRRRPLRRARCPGWSRPRADAPAHRTALRWWR